LPDILGFSRESDAYEPTRAHEIHQLIPIARCLTLTSGHALEGACPWTVGARIVVVLSPWCVKLL
jgi:hypothetical protein